VNSVENSTVPGTTLHKLPTKVRASVGSVRRRVGKRGFAVVAAIACIALAVGLSAGLGVGPFSSGTNRPSLSNASPEGNGFWGATTGTAGQVVDFPVMVQNNGAQPAVLLSAVLIPVPGFRTPRLVHLAVLKEHLGIETSAVGWPISVQGCYIKQGRCLGKNEVLATRPMKGFVVLPHGRHGPGPLSDMIEYGVVGTRLGRYGAAGLLVSYRVGGSIQTARLLDGGLVCVATSRNKSCSVNGFDAAFSRLLHND